MRVLLTGADGMLGSHSARVLLRDGHEVRALVQPQRSTGTLAGLGVETFNGDLLNSSDIRAAVRGCDALLHTVASTSIWPSRQKFAWQLNYRVVQRLVEAAVAADVSKIVHIGTANSFAPGPIDAPGTENNSYTDGRFGLDYQDSKYAAQQWLLEQHRDNGLPVTIVDPTFMFGAYDSKPGSGRMILSVYGRRVPGYTRGGKNYVYAGDVAVAAVNALRKGADGRCYIAGCENLSYSDAFALIASEVGVAPPKRYIPPPFTLLYGAVSSGVARLSGTEPGVSLPMARLSNTDCYYDNSRAVTELDMPQTPVRHAVAEAFGWFQENGYLERC